MGRSGGCCNFQHSVNCTAPPCPSGSCCFITNESVNEFVEFDNSNTLYINKKLNNYSCEDFVTQNCCLTKPFSLFNENEICGEIEACETGSTIALPSIYSTDGSFAVLTSDGHLICFGFDLARGIGRVPLSSILPNSLPYLENVVSVYSNPHAFVAVHKDRTATVWGDPSKGGSFLPSFTPGEDLDTLENIKSVIPSSQAFAAIKKDGTVIAWGNPKYGGSIPSSIKNLLVDIVEIVSSQYYFAARNKQGRIFIWGNEGKAYDKRDVNRNGTITENDSSEILDHLGISQAQAEANPNLEGLYNSAYDVNKKGTVTAADALIIINDLNSGDVVTYDSGFRDIKKIYSTEMRSKGFITSEFSPDDADGSGAFAFLNHDGTVFTWGDPAKGGNTGQKQSDLTDVKKIYNTQQAFMALRNDGKVVMWGDVQTLKDVGPDSTFYDEVVDVIPSLFSFGLYYYKASQVPDRNYFQVEQFFEPIGSIYPNKPTLMSMHDEFGVTDQTHNWDGRFFIERDSFLSSVSYPLSENYSVSKVKNNIYASTYAMHVFSRRNYSIGNNNLTTGEGGHNFNILPNYHFNDNAKYISVPIRFDNEDGLSSKAARENNTLFHKSKSFVFNEYAVSYLTKGNRNHTTARLNVDNDIGGMFEELNYVVSFGRKGYGGADGTTFMKSQFSETDSPRLSSIGNKGFFQGLYSNRYGFCGIRVGLALYDYFDDLLDTTSWGDSAGVGPLRFRDSNNVQKHRPEVTYLDGPDSLNIFQRQYYYEIVYWGLDTPRDSKSEGVTVETRSTPFRFLDDLKDTHITHQGCHPDFCDQDIT